MFQCYASPFSTLSISYKSKLAYLEDNKLIQVNYKNYLYWVEETYMFLLMISLPYADVGQQP